MNIKYILCLGIAALSGVHASARFLGPSTGGGGFVLSCPQTQVSEASTELLDLYEGRNTLGFRMAGATGDLREDYFDGVDRTYTLQGQPNLAEQRREAILDNLVKFMQSVKFVSTASDLPTANDLGEMPWIPSQCKIQQLAYFDDRTGTVFVLKSVWDQMDSVNRAALVHHELHFRDQRRVGEKTSENTRRSVAQVFALEGNIPLKDGLPAGASEFSSYLWYDSNVSSKISVFYGVNYLGGTGRLQFTHVNGIAQFGKTWADFPNMIWDFKLARSTENPQLVACILQTSGMDKEYSSAIQGPSVKGYLVQLRLKTGEPIKMTILKDGTQVGEGYVGGGTNCSASLH